MPIEGIGQLYLRLLTDNFEEATRARKAGRAPRFSDDRGADRGADRPVDRSGVPGEGPG